MTSGMKRRPEPERMTAPEEDDYAKADYSQAHEVFVDELLTACDRAGNVAVADLGCGPGDILLRLRRRKPKWQFHGIDLSERMLAFALKAANSVNGERPVRWIRADIKDTGLPARLFDVIISNSVLHHLEKPVQFWREIARLAKYGAFAFVRDLRRPTNERTAHVLVERHVGTESHVVQTHYLSSLFSAFTVEEVRKQLQAAGLSGLTVRPVGDRYLDVLGRVEPPSPSEIDYGEATEANA